MDTKERIFTILIMGNQRTMILIENVNWVR